MEMWVEILKSVGIGSSWIIQHNKSVSIDRYSVYVWYKLAIWVWEVTVWVGTWINSEIMGWESILSSSES